jgi:hypothetical protein
MPTSYIDSGWYVSIWTSRPMCLTRCVAYLEVRGKGDADVVDAQITAKRMDTKNPLTKTIVGAYSFD